MRMSLFYAVMIVGSSQLLLAHSSLGQPAEQRTTKIALEDENFRTLFKKLKEQTGLSVVFRKEVGEYKSINLPMAERTVNELLYLVLKETDLTYHFKDNKVFIYKGGNDEGIKTDATSINSQSIFPITGKVTDVTNRQPLVGVSIYVKGTNRGTTTDGEGKFVIDTEENEVLVFSFIGFKTFEVTVGNMTVIDVIMEEDISMLKSIEVIGTTYSSTTKERSTSSIVKVTAREIERQPVTSPLMALQGRVPGLEITPQTGGPGSAPKIRIRGNNSLRADGGFPLYIIDGIAIESSHIFSDNATILAGHADPLSTINPANIESIEVLKDADATAIYGSRGANGVIVIRTKQAKADDITNFGITAYTGVGEISNRVESLNTQQYLEMRRKAFRNDSEVPNMYNAPDLLLWDTTRYTDWQEELLGGTANIFDVQSVLSGGSHSTSFRSSIGYHKETLVFPGDFNYQRLNAGLSVNHLSANKKFKVTMNLNYGYEKNKLFSDLNIITQALTIPPNAPPLYDKNGDLNWAPRPDGFSSFQNPLALLKNEDKSTTGNLVTNALITYELLPSLSLKANLGFTDLHSDEMLIVPISSFAPELRDLKRGRATFTDNKRNSWIIEPQLSYYKETPDHSLTIVLGSTIQASSKIYEAIYAEDYTSDALLGSLKGARTYQTNEIISFYRYLSLFSRVQYAYNERYLLSVSARRDGSSRFGPDRRFGNFYSIAPAWIFSEESFVKEKLGFLKFGKLRASYGTTGNDQIGDYKYYNTFNFGALYKSSSSLVSTGLFNPDFAWELTSKMEVAAELGFVDNRVSFEVNWYRNISSNQLVNFQLPATTGFSSVFSNFDATIQNTGLEVILSTVNIARDKLKWVTSVNISFPKNELIAFRDIENSPYNKKYKVGEPLSIQRLYVWEGIDPQTGRHKFSDFNGNGLVDDEDKVFMNPGDRKFYGGMLNTFQFNNFEFSFLLQFSKQRASKMLLRMPGQYYNQPVTALSYWENEGDISDNPRLSQKFSGLASDNQFIDFGNSTMSNYNDTDASFVRVKTLSLSYQIPKKLIQRISAKECRLFVQGQNLFTATRYVNLDPETRSALPPLRIFTVGLNLMF